MERQKEKVWSERRKFTIDIIVGQIRLHRGGEIMEEIPSIPRDRLALRLSEHKKTKNKKEEP